MFWCGTLRRRLTFRLCRSHMMLHPPCPSLRLQLRMNSTILSALPGHSQLRRLIALRGIAVAAQLITLALVWKILELELDWQPMLLTIATLASLNLFSWLRLRSQLN